MDKILVTRSSMPSYEEYCNEIKDLWDSHWLTNNGVKHKQLEEELSKYLGVKHSTCFTNGHLALESAIDLFNFPKGSEIITTPYTFVSTTNAIVRCGMVPVFCDISEEDFCIDVTKIEELITDKTVAILAVHVYGNVCNVEEIDRIAKKYNLKVIYDAAHAFGVKYKGKGIATYGDISMFSFHATKVFNTIEGGCLCYANDEYEQTLKDIRNFGIRNEEECNFIGGNSKMNEFQAAMGLCNLRHINEYIAGRKRATEEYDKLLSGIDGIRVRKIQKDVESNYSYYPVIFDGFKLNRDQVKELLAEHDIGTRKYFYPITNEYEAYNNYNKGNTEKAKAISNSVLTLPLFHNIDLDIVNRICFVIRSKEE